MKKIIICLICLVALMAASAVTSSAQGGLNVTTNANSTMNATINKTANSTMNDEVNGVSKPALHVGFENVKPVSNLDRFGAKAVYNIEAYSQNKLLFNGSNAAQVQPVFNVGQRSGIPPTIVYNTGQTKPMYSVSPSPPNPVDNIEEYSPIKIGTPIP